MPNPADPKELSRPSGDLETPAIFLRLDTPTAGQRLPPSRPVTVAGWALTVMPIAEIVVELAGAVERAALGVHRPDLVRAFPAYPQVANSGFSCVIASAAAGKGAELTVTLRTVNGPKKVVVVALTFDAAPEALRPAWAGRDQTDAMVLQVDEAMVDRLGVLRVAGWVIAHGRVETVAVHAEDRLIGAAEYGIKRADVALAWPDYRNAESSGYLLATDATVLKDAKQIRVVATAAGGLSREAMVAVQTADRPVRRRPRDVNEFYCDAASLSTSGAIFLKGWAVSSAGIERIVVLFEGEMAGAARLGSERPDIGNKFPTVPQSRQSGFAFQANVDRAKVKGEHVLVVQVVLRNGEAKDYKVAVAARQIEVPGHRGDDPGGEILLHFDDPIVVDRVATRAIEGNLTIAGWALARDGVDSVTITMDGVPVGTAHYGIRREDVARAFPGREGAALGGFAYSLAHRSLTAGDHRIAVTVTTKGGHKRVADFAIKVTADVEHPGGGPWLLRHRIPAAEITFSRGLIEQMSMRPKVHVWISCRRHNVERLAKTLRALAAQFYDDWAAVLSGDARCAPAVAAMLADEFPQLAGRVRQFLGKREANDLVDGLKPRDLILPLDAGDVLSPDALFEFAFEAARSPDADFLYADERRVNPATSRRDAFFKPDWSPNLLLATNYVGRPWCATAELMRRTKRRFFAGAPAGNFELILHCTEMASAVAHLKGMLCERDEDNLESKADETRALRKAVKRRRLRGSIEPGRVENTYRFRPKTVGNDLVSIIIPTCASGGLIKPCIEGLRNISTYRQIEIVCIDNILDETSEWKPWLRRYADVVVEIPDQFNWSCFNNIAAAEASGKYLLFLNDDIEVVQPDWLEALLEPLQQSGVAVVGPQLLYPDRKVQHAGMFLAGPGIARHAFRFCPEDDPGYFGLAHTTRDVIAVTGACMLTRKETFEKLGRFEEAHAVVNNDLDFCLKVNASKLRCVFTPHARLIHHEAASRANLKEEYDTAAFNSRWGSLASAGDPYFHPNLDTNHDIYQVRSEPTETLFCGQPLYRASDIKRILAVKVDHIGDFVTSLPAMRRLKTIFPGAKLFVLAAPASGHLAALEPAIDRTLPFAFYHARSALGHKEVGEERSASLEALRRQLAPLKFDLAVDLRKHGDTRKLLKYSGALLTAGFDFRGEFAWLDIALNWEGDNQLARKRQHVSNDLVNLVDSIAAAGEQHRTAFNRPPDWSTRQVPIISRLTGLGLYRRRIVCVHPASGNEMRQWPERHFAGIINLLLDTEEIDIAVIGGPDESDTANRVLDMVNDKDRVYMLAGKFKLNELPLFLDSCALFIGNNSGPKHIAAHLGVPTIGVHSGVVDAREWGPVGDAAVAVRRDMICAPCYLAKREDCHRQLACVEGLVPSHLLPMCRKMLALGRGIVITA